MRPVRLSIAVTAIVVAFALLGLPGAAAQNAGGEAEPDRFLTGPNEGEPEAIAIDYLQGEAASYGLSDTDVAELAVRSAPTSRHTGVTHVNLNQRFDGLEVFGADTTVSIAPDGSVVFVAGSAVAGLRAAVAATPELDAVDAVEAAAEELDLDEPRDLEVISEEPGPDRETLLTPGGISDEPIPARLGWQPTADGLRLAWQLVIDDASDVNLWNAIVDARTGEVLQVEDWTSQSSIAGLASLLARPAGTTSTALAAQATPDPVDDGSSYRVFALPAESPNDGPRTLVTNPADALASPFGWHDVSGTPEPDFTTTRGNNVHAYTDHFAQNVAQPGADAEGGPSLDFDFPLDLTAHPHDYADAAVTNLFYWCNVAHDVFYRYGFDEPSGNFQVNNYGRGGVGGDDVRCEAQDGGGLNNANFSTPAADGGRPRMQMFLWDVGVTEPLNLVIIDPPSPAAGTYGATGAAFGPAPDADGVAGEVVLVDDGTDAPSEGCDPLIGFPAGAVALMDRGSCPFVQKVGNAQAAGAVAVIMVNNAAGNPITMGGSDPTIVIPSVMVSLNDGNTIKAGLPAAGQVRMNTDRGALRDGDLESGIVIHEYSHGVSLRLTGGPGINCLTGQEQMGEGWSDWHALAMLIDPAVDDPEGPRGMGTYALWQDDPPRVGPGIRPRPYSRNMQIQPFTYDSIRTGAWLGGASLATPHGVGHGWAAVLWDMVWDLIDKHGFNPNVYESWDTGGNNLAYQLVMDGLKFQGCGPGFVVGRDAIIVADEVLTGGDNACTLWASFARRGLGFSAVQGTTNRNDNTEAFDTHPACAAGFQAPIRSGPGELNTVGAGSTIQLRFSLGSDQGLDILASNSPFSRQVDCTTLAVVSEGPDITPRARPINTVAAGGSGLTVNGAGVYRYGWKTMEEWFGTCRELVLTRTDGVQHRAFFHFDA
jgi:extracellular elastinolytic metalloproteinase